MFQLKPFIASLLIICQIVVVPQIFAKDNTSTPGYATPGEATADGMYIHGAKPGILLIRVHVLGAIAQQGIHYYPENVDLLDAMLYAGGMGETTNLNDIEIRRRNVEELIEIDLENLIEDGDKIPILKDGDIVKVSYNWRRDISTIGIITGFFASMTSFTLTLIALTR